LSDIARAVDIAELGPARARALATLGETEFNLWRLPESRAHLEAALREPGVDDELRCRIHAGLSLTLQFMEENEVAAQHAERALSLARSVRQKAVKVGAYAAAARARAIREGKVADELMREAPELWQPLDELPVSEWPRFSLAQELVALGDEEAGTLVDELLHLAEERGDEFSREILLFQRAEVLERTGDWQPP
jgi:tetratricopeptide (TPR) repeat protein